MRKIVDGIAYVTIGEDRASSCRGCAARYTHALCDSLSGNLRGNLTAADYSCKNKIWILASDKKPTMEMVIVPTDTLSTYALDWAAAKYLGYVHKDGNVYINGWRPHDDWTQTGAIIESEWISVYPVDGDWRAVKQGFCEATGPTPHTAVLRCFVRLWAGSEVAVPRRLVKYD